MTSIFTFKPNTMMPSEPEVPMMTDIELINQTLLKAFPRQKIIHYHSYTSDNTHEWTVHSKLGEMKEVTNKYRHDGICLVLVRFHPRDSTVRVWHKFPENDSNRWMSDQSDKAKALPEIIQNIKDSFDELFRILLRLGQ